jgi:tRNA threonylcarbamoyl adenosine modification protein (Sua5/YciO/YrdC/YwlC family)
MAQIVKLFAENPSPRVLRLINKVLEDGGVIVYPTDTVYSFGCDLTNAKALDKVAQLKGTKKEKADFSIIFDDLSRLADYTKPIDTQTFKMLKRCLPGAFTFILSANSAVPRLFKNKKKTIGIRIPDNAIPRAIVEQLGRPIVATSVHDDDAIIEYTTDPELIAEKYEHQVDLVIDGGMGSHYASTVVDLTGDKVEIIREGRGDVALL